MFRGRTIDPPSKGVQAPQDFLSSRNAIQSFEGVGVFVNQQNERGCLRIGFGAPTYPTLTGWAGAWRAYLPYPTLTGWANFCRAYLPNPYGLG